MAERSRAGSKSSWVAREEAGNITQGKTKKLYPGKDFYFLVAVFDVCSQQSKETFVQFLKHFLPQISLCPWTLEAVYILHNTWFGLTGLLVLETVWQL